MGKGSLLSGQAKKIQGQPKTQTWLPKGQISKQVSVEHWDLKPYAIPVRALPFTSIKDAKLRELCDVLKATMENFGIVVVGKEVHSL